MPKYRGEFSAVHRWLFGLEVEALMVGARKVVTMKPSYVLRDKIQEADG